MALANSAPLSPLTFLYRAASVFGERISIVHGSLAFTWAQTLDRCRRLASVISSFNIKNGDVVSIVAPNVPALYEMHFGVPMAGAILNALNIRLDARSVSVLLRHSGAKLVFVDYEFLPLIQKAVQLVSPAAAQPIIVIIRNEVQKDQLEELEYEKLLSSGDPDFPLKLPADEEDCISLNYTSGTTSEPKGVLYTHKGAYLNSIASVLLWNMTSAPVYLWTLPMFHCNGWCFTWAVAAQAGTNICIRNTTAAATFDAIRRNGVTHMSGAPIVLNMLTSSSEARLPHKVAVITGGAPPAASILSRMEGLGFDVTHSYGLTETYGPALVCEWKAHWNSFPLAERAQLKSRQGVVHLGLAEVDVKDPLTMISVPKDGKTVGEVMLRGNTVMKAYFRDEKATRKAFEGGWFHSGDLGVIHPDGYVQLKDRSKDIIISGGENISSIEVESALYAHPQILEAAVVARPDEYWGETPCAFVTLKEGESLSAEKVISFCRDHLPHYMIPRTVVFSHLPKTSTGKIQKFILRDQAKLLGSQSKL